MAGTRTAGGRLGRSVTRDTAADVADDLAAALRGVARPVVDDAISAVSLMVLAILLVPVGIVIVAAGFVLMALTFEALGAPTGIAATAITVTGLVGILGALFFAFRALYRRMPRRLRAAYAAPMEAAPPNAVVFLTQGTGSEDVPEAMPEVRPAPTLAELDARLAPQPSTPDVR